MQDAVILANHLYDIQPTSFENIKKALSDYNDERFGAVRDQYPQSHISAKILFGHVSSSRKPVCYHFTACMDEEKVSFTMEPMLTDNFVPYMTK